MTFYVLLLLYTTMLTLVTTSAYGHIWTNQQLFSVLAIFLVSMSCVIYVNY
jgi:hypothetical protein